MSRRDSSLLLHLLLLVLRAAAEAEQTQDAGPCGGGGFLSGGRDFVLDSADAVRRGAALLAAARVTSAADCERRCCENAHCNLALLKPRAAPTEDTRTCALFDCVHRNRFVCQFVNKDGYESFVRRSAYQQHLQGPGKQAPPIANAGPDVIVQPGEAVMLNGIESLAPSGADITTYSWRRLKGHDDVITEKTSLPDQLRLSNLHAGAYVFKLTVSDSRGQTGTAMVRVLVLSPELSAPYCLAPPKTGPCRAAFPRWHYDAVTQRCTNFTFGGCQPNKNNFLSDEECTQACRNITGSSERMILPTGEECGVACRPEQLVCSNGCCLDRSLECDGMKHCSDGSDEDACTKLNRTFSQLLSVDVDRRTLQCTESPDTGPCRASFPRWYYHPTDRKCYRFTYGGCSANGNNFDDDQTCSKTCGGVTEKNLFSRGIFEAFETDEDNSGSVALAVVLTIGLLALIAVLSYCFLRARRKRSQGSGSASAAQAALSEQEAFVYNSTTKPV